jgi:hypothetical protein
MRHEADETIQSWERLNPVACFVRHKIEFITVASTAVSIISEQTNPLRIGYAG